MDDDYKGIRVGVEVKLGESLPPSELIVTVILLEEIKRRDPKAYKAAVKAIEETES